MTNPDYLNVSFQSFWHSFVVLTPRSAPHDRLVKSCGNLIVQINSRNLLCGRARIYLGAQQYTVRILATFILCGMLWYLVGIGDDDAQEV